MSKQKKLVKTAVKKKKKIDEKELANEEPDLTYEQELEKFINNYKLRNEYDKRTLERIAQANYGLTREGLNLIDDAETSVDEINFVLSGFFIAGGGFEKITLDQLLERRGYKYRGFDISFLQMIYHRIDPLYSNKTAKDFYINNYEAKNEKFQ